MAQILPVDDSFTENATHYGAFLPGYMRLRPWTVDGVTSYVIPTAVGNLSAAYFGSGAGYGGIYRRDVRLASCVTNSSDAANGYLVSHLWRQHYATRVKATLTFSLAQTAGAATADSFRFAGVTVRNSGGSFIDTAGSEHNLLNTGYWFVLANTLALGPQWILLRVNAGVLTQLATATTTANFPDILTGVKSQQRSIALQVDDSGGNPVLTATTLGGTGGTPQTVFSYTDSSVNKITAAGRCGFGMSRDRQEAAGVKTVTLSPTFSIYDIAQAKDVLRDEWGRNDLSLTAFAVSDGNGFSGRQLSSMWDQDVTGRWGVLQNVSRDAGNNRVLDNAGIDMIHNIPPTDSSQQRRQATVNVNWSLGTRTATVILRGAKAAGTFGGLVGGYRFTLDLEVLAGRAIAYLFRIEPNGLQTVLARKGLTDTLTHASLSLVSATDFVLDAEVKNVGGTSTANGTPRLVMKVGATQIVFNEVFTAAGAQIGAANEILDYGSTATLAGQLQGVFLTGGSTSYFSEWVDVPLTGITTDEDDQATIPVTTECTGKTGTLTVPYDWPVERLRSYRVAEHHYESGTVNRLLLSKRERRRWSVHASAATDAEKATLWTFWNDHKGIELPFDFVPPEGGSAVCARFADDALATAVTAPSVRTFSFEVVEGLA